jgi:hypothetical protein
MEGIMRLTINNNKHTEVPVNLELVQKGIDVNLLANGVPVLWIDSRRKCVVMFARKFESELLAEMGFEINTETTEVVVR